MPINNKFLTGVTNLNDIKLLNVGKMWRNWDSLTFLEGLRSDVVARESFNYYLKN